MLGLIHPDGGEIEVFGKKAEELKPEDKQKLGVVFADSGFSMYLTAAERSPIARVPFISRSRRIRDYQDSSKTLRNQTLPSRPRTRIFTLQEELEHL